MKFLNSTKGKIYTVLVVFALISSLYFIPDRSGKDTASEPYEENGIITDSLKKSEKSDAVQEIPPEKSEAVPDSKPDNEGTVKEEKNELYCTLSVRCDTVFDNLSMVKSEILDILPKNGVIFAEQELEFSEGESVFDLLLRVMKDNKIHLEFVNTPVYGSVYIEGIGNLYEFDAGELSGWMYKVNGEFPNYGCSKYYLKKGDKVEFVYTCDLGKDVGGAYAKGQVADNE